MQKASATTTTDANGKQVTEADPLKALSAAVASSVSVENLARYFGITTQQVKDFVFDNAEQVVQEFRKSGQDPNLLQSYAGIPAPVIQRGIALADARTSLQSGDLTLDRIINEAIRAGEPLDLFVKNYFNNDQALLARLETEQQFTPQERAWREAVRNTTTPITVQQAVEFQTANKLSDADMQRVFGVNPQKLQEYRTSETQRQAAEAEQRRIAGLQLKDAETGKSYNAAELIKLYNQMAPNLDTQLAGSVFGPDVRDALANNPQSVNIGFNAVEAAKLFGQTPSAAQMVILDMARNLLNAGVTDVSQIKKGEIQDAYPVDDFGNRATYTRVGNVGPNGQEIILGNTFTGKQLGGGTQYALEIGSDGKPRFFTEGIDTSDSATIVPLVAFALNIAVPGAGAALGAALGVSGTAAAVVGNAIISAGLQVASGVPVEKALRNAVVTAGVQTIVPNFTGNPYIDNAVRSVATGALTGQPVEKALANSLIQTGAVQNLSGVSITGDRVLDSGIVSSATSAVQALATGADVGASAIAGLSRGLGAAADQERVRRDSAVSGAGFIGEAPFTPTPVVS